MATRLVMFKAGGERAVHPLSLHHKEDGRPELRLVMETSTERFEEWLFFFLRDHGAFIETGEPAAVCRALNLPEGEDGIVYIKA